MPENDEKRLPSIEVKTNYVHKGVVTDMLEKRTKAGVMPIGMVTTYRFSKPAKDLLDEHDIAWAEIPESEILESENSEKE